MAPLSCFNHAVQHTKLGTCELDDSEDFVHLVTGNNGDVGAPAATPEDFPDTTYLFIDIPDDDFGVTALITVSLQNLIKE